MLEDLLKDLNIEETQIECLKSKIYEIVLTILQPYRTIFYIFLCFLLIHFILFLCNLGLSFRIYQVLLNFNLRTTTV
jgi:hypothetical protein